MSEIIKQCITCNEEGHTYLECPKVNFFSLMCGAAGVEPITGPSIEETRNGIMMHLTQKEIRE